MEPKKNKAADLNRQRPLLLSIGMIISLGLVTTALEWRSEVEPIIGLPEMRRGCFSDVPINKSRYDYSVPVTIWSEDDPKVVVIREPNTGSVGFTLCGLGVIEGRSSMEPESYCTLVEEMPMYPGGMQALKAFLEAKIKYPSNAKRMGIEGRVFVMFIVEKDGSLSNLEVIKGIESACDLEALRVMELIPSFNPGKQRGIPVRVKMVVPIEFQLK